MALESRGVEGHPDHVSNTTDIKNGSVTHLIRDSIDCPAAGQGYQLLRSRIVRSSSVRRTFPIDYEGRCNGLLQGTSIYSLSNVNGNEYAALRLNSLCHGPQLQFIPSLYFTLASVLEDPGK